MLRPSAPDTHLRPTLLAFAISLAVAIPLCAQESRLPDIGSSAAQVITPAQQAEYGAMVLSQLRHYDLLLEDPLLDAWLGSLGSRLAAVSDQPGQDFTFFLLKQRQINAFATLGGYIGANAGLVLTAQSEDEVAAVMSHEVAHVTQAHVLRAVERAQRDSLPILLAMLGAIVIAQQAGGSSGGKAAEAAMATATALMQQRQIDYSRSNESEADRVGISTLSRAGYDVAAMAGFFERMSTASRGNSGGYQTPDYLKTHPVTTTRISEAKERAARMPAGVAPAVDPGPTDNPMLPASVRLRPDTGRGGSGEFSFARERLRVLSAETPAAAIREFEALKRNGVALDAAQRYGLALAHLQAGQAIAARDQLATVTETRDNALWLALALAEVEARAGHPAAADTRFADLLARMPANRPVVLTYARVLAERGGAEAGRLAVSVLRPLLGRSANDPLFQLTFARASEIAGDPVRAGEAYAEAAYLGGRPEQALIQLNTLKKRSDLDYYARARIDARIAAITPAVLELRRQGVRDEDLRPH